MRNSHDKDAVLVQRSLSMKTLTFGSTLSTWPASLQLVY